MPAPSSFLTGPAIGQLAELAGDAAGDAPGLLTVLGGARSFTAIAGWAAGADQETLARLGVTGAVPSEPAFRRTLQRLDADAFDDLAGERAARRTAPGKGVRRDIAVDGKTLRGSGHGGDASRHLLAALDHAHGAVLGQVEAGATTSEIPLFSALPGRTDIAGAAITAGALHARRDHATCLAGRGAHDVLIVNRSQPGLHSQLARLPWRDVPVACHASERGHGRAGRRTLKVTAASSLTWTMWNCSNSTGCPDGGTPNRGVPACVPAFHQDRHAVQQVLAVVVNGCLGCGCHWRQSYSLACRVVPRLRALGSG